MSDWQKLADRCEHATGPDRELDVAIVEAFGWRRKGGFWSGEYWERRNERLWFLQIPKLTGSLDAAMSLVPEGWRFAGSQTMRLDFYAHLITRELTDKGAKAHAEGHGDTLALAICAAALRARSGVDLSGS